jgi:hypothetical protein
VDLIFSDVESVDLIFSEESVDLVFSLKYSAMKVTDRISSSRNNMKKTMRTFEGFRISVSSNRPKGNLAISVNFLKLLIFQSTAALVFLAE